MIRLRLKGVKELRPFSSPFKDRLLQLYLKHLHQLVSDYIYTRIHEGRLGRSRWRRYAYYRGWVLGRYGSDRARKKGVPKIPANFPGAEKVRFLLLAKRLERYAGSKQGRKAIRELAQTLVQEANNKRKSRLIQRMLEDQSSPLSDWLRNTKAGQRTAKFVERKLLRLNRLYRIDIARERKNPRQRLSYWIRKGIPTTVRHGWKYAVQTGQLAKAWQQSEMLTDIQKGQASIIPKESLDSIRTRLGRRSLSVILSRTLKASGQSGAFLSPSVFGRLSRKAMELAVKEMGVRLQ